MCGRFSIDMSAKALEKIYGALFEEEVNFTQFNIAPTQNVPVILNEDSGLFQLVKWGILPKWLEKQGKTTGLINVRSETVLEKPTFKKDFQERRCIIPATSFFEWDKQDGKKVPYLIKMKDSKPFCFAGVWSEGKDKEGNPIKTFAILTTEANDLLTKIHDRMPVILSEDEVSEWLSDETNIDDLINIMSPYSADLMEMHTISDKINNPRNNFKELLNPL